MIELENVGLSNILAISSIKGRVVTKLKYEGAAAREESATKGCYTSSSGLMADFGVYSKDP